MAVLKVYKDVIDDVLSSAREMFLEDGVDEQVLQELKQSWEAKLMASKAVDTKSEIEKQITKKSNNASSGGGAAANAHSGSTEVANGNGMSKAQGQQMKQVVGQVAPNNHVQTPQQINAAAAAAAAAQQQVVETKMVPIQITLPAQPGTNVPQRVLTIQVPAPALNDNLLHKVLTGQVITTTMNLPPSIASSVLQQHVNAAFSQLAPSMMSGIIGTTGSPNKTVIQNDGAADDAVPFEITVLPIVGAAPKSKKKAKAKRITIEFVQQSDGPMDTSDDDDEGSDDDEISDNDDDEKDEDEQEMDDGGPEEEPLNSEDDVTDEDPADLFDTDNVVVCQYDKITRSRNKWKFHLKDGIMNLKGEDYVFQKANGDAEW